MLNSFSNSMLELKFQFNILLTACRKILSYYSDYLCQTPIKAHISIKFESFFFTFNFDFNNKPPSIGGENDLILKQNISQLAFN